MKLSPSTILFLFFLITYLILSLIAPKCIGICGALAISPPLSSNKAHEKSNLSLIFIE